MKPVFLDTVGIIAILDQTDQWHSVASAAYCLLGNNRRTLVTTPLVMLECGNAAARRSYRQDVAQLVSKFESQSRVVRPSDQEVDQAWRDYARFPIRGPSIVDCISFQVMRRLGLTEVFTNDQHFADAGFTVLF